MHQVEAGTRVDSRSDPGMATEDLVLAAAARRRGLWALLRRKRVPMVCLGIVAVFGLAALLAPILAPHDPNFGYYDGLTMTGAPLGSTGKFLLGTDPTGRDVLSRLLYGSRISLTVGVLSTALTVLLGLSLGSIAGYFGGWAEIVITRLIDIMLAFPVVLLGMAIAAILTSSIATTIGVIALTQWMYMARVVYSQVQTLKEWEFVTAARAMGIGERRIVLRHIAPHMLPLLIAYSTLTVGTSILLEATLSYLNAGVPKPTASWGSMISDGLTYYRADPSLVLYPGVAILVVVLAFTLLGDGLTAAIEGR
ncbi:MAG TPA: ABC transporter permease [Chloroflexota bacterium]|nr:ABC transporter permease [Chloroflexota bacterium]